VSPGKTHRHIERPSEEQLRELVATRPQAISDLYIALHRLVLYPLPDVQYAVDPKDLMVGYGSRK